MKVTVNKLKIDKMIDEAIVDAYNEGEQAAGFLGMIEDHLACPFTARVVGETVDVTGFDSEGGTTIVALCKRHDKRYRVSVTSLEWEGKPPKGAEWIEAYRAWVRRVRRV